MLVRGNEKAWKRMRDLSDHDMNLSLGEEERKKADGAEASGTPVQIPHFPKSSPPQCLGDVGFFWWEMVT